MGFLAMTTTAVSLLLISSLCNASIADEKKPIYVGGWEGWEYIYEETMLPLPSEAAVEHAHGIYIDEQTGIIITYKDMNDSSKCLLHWAPGRFEENGVFLGPGSSLCAGVPHGLRAAVENNTTYLYHANNEQALHKTTLSGDIVWTTNGKPTKNTSVAYRPTWFATQPASISPYAYLADGYGSNRIYVYYRNNGTYTGHSFGGPGSLHGQFQTCHAVTWDWRIQKMVVCDRENHRLEYFDVMGGGPSFYYTHTASYPELRRPCNIRIHHPSGIAIVPALEGMVGILDARNQLISLINITEALGARGFLHPHDAHFVPGPSGDFVLVTWNPGRVGYFRRVRSSTTTTTTKLALRS
jgi:hypothetical protein